MGQKYRVKAPDGSVYEVTAPDGASEQDAIAYVQRNQGSLTPKSNAEPLPQQPINAKPPRRPTSYEMYGAPPAPPKRGLWETVVSDFTEPLDAGKRVYAEATAPWDKARHEAVANPTLGNIAKAGLEGVKAIPGQVGGALMQGSAPFSGLFNAVTKPAARGIDAGTRGIGLTPYRSEQTGDWPWERTSVPMSPEESINEWNNTLSLGLMGPVKAPPRAVPRPRIAPDVRTLRAQEVPLTPGQAKGGLYRAVEEAATSAPILGPKIQEARATGIERFNRANTNTALRPIGERLPDDIETGHQAIKYSGDLLSSRYDALAPSSNIPVRQDIDSAMGAMAADINLLTPQGRATLESVMNNRVNPRVHPMTGEITGVEYQRVISELNKDIGNFGRSLDPDHRAIAEVLKGVKSSLEGTAARVDPNFASQKAALDEGWAQLARTESAATRAGTEGGIYSPAQYDATIRSGNNQVRHRGHARGEIDGQEFASAARRVLPSKTPDSGTAGRAALLTPLGVMGGGFMAGGPMGALKAAAGYGVAAGGLKGLSLMYEPAAIARFNAKLDRQIAAMSGPPRTTQAKGLPPVGLPGASSGAPLSHPANDLPAYLRAVAAEQEDKKEKRKKE